MQRCTKEMNNDQNEKLVVPFIAYESVLARNERIVRRLIITIVILATLLVVSNFAWLYAWCQYEYVDEEVSTTTTTVKQDGEGQNVYGNGNEVNGSDNNSKTDSKAETKETEEER